MLKEFELFDSHLHIIDSRFPLIPNNGFTPDAFSCEDYRTRLASYKLIGGAIVSGSFQAFDQSYLISALATLGTNYVGVTQLPATVTDEEILSLDKAGIRALRFNLYRGGSENLKHLLFMAQRVHELVGWHVELYIDSNDLGSLSTALVQLPSFSVDHLGLRKSGFKQLLSMVDKGAKVKATGFGRIDFDPLQAIKEILNVNPDSLMFATDLPSTRAPEMYHDNDYLKVADSLGRDSAVKIFSENALTFYRLI